MSGRGLAQITTDRAGNVFFVSENRVLRLDGVSGVVTLVAGGGYPGFSGDNGPAALAQLDGPAALAVDSTGALYLNDRGNVRIRRIANGIITTVAGNGTFGFSGDNGPAVNAQISTVWGLAMDSDDNLYFTDSFNHRVRKISKGGVISTIAGTGTQGYSGDNGPATSAELELPGGVVVDSAGVVYISDGNNVVRAVSKGVITTFAGSRSPGPASGDNGPATSAYMLQPFGLAVDAAGSLYIAERGFHRIRKVTKGVITTIAGNGREGYEGDGGPAVNAKLDEPWGVAMDSTGNLYISDVKNYRIRKVANGLISTVVGNGQLGFSGSNGPAANGEFSTPTGVAIDASGAVYVAAMTSHRVLKISNGVLTLVAGGGVAGFSGDGGPATNAQLDSPNGIAVDAGGSIYIADSKNNRVRRVTNGIITTVAGTGFATLGGDGGPATNAQLSNPSAVALDNLGNLYISDWGNYRIRKVSGGVITTIAGTTAGYSGDNGPAVQAQLFGPQGMAVDSAGNLFFVDSGNQMVRKISNGMITSVAGIWSSGFSGDGGPATSAQFSNPMGVALDSAGSLYIADYQNYRIRKVTNGVITTIAGTGKSEFSGDSGPATSAGLSLPASLVVDASGNVFFSDITANRVRVLVPAGVACTYTVSPTSMAAPPLGGDVEFTVKAPGYCPWKVEGLPDWMVYSSAIPGAQSATVHLTATANSGTARSATIGIGGASLKVTQSGPPAINSGGILNAASSAVGGALAPGSIATAYGTFPVGGVSSASGSPLPYNLAGLSMQFSANLGAPLYSLSAGQVSFQVPWELTGQSQGFLSASANGQTSGAQSVRLAPFAPGIFSMNSQGTGQGAVLDAQYRLVDASNPATAGVSAIQIYCTGLGTVSDRPASGVAAKAEPLSYTDTIPTVSIGGVQSTVLFSGLTPGAVGLYQVNAVVPAGASKGAAVPVVISIGGSTSNTVTIAVQ
jgi:uncharacterized protein (TIGR03437 family)